MSVHVVAAILGMCPPWLPHEGGKKMLEAHSLVFNLFNFHTAHKAELVRLVCPTAKRLGNKVFNLPRSRGQLRCNECMLCLPQLKFFSSLDLNSEFLTHVSNCLFGICTWDI